MNATGTSPNINKLLTPREVAGYLNVSLRTVEKEIAEERLKPLWVRGVRRFRMNDVQAYLEQSA